MRRLTPTASAVPANLKTYGWRRWEREETAARAERDRAGPTPYSFVANIFAPNRYRAALTEAVGPVAGDRYFWAQMSSPRVQKHKADAARAGAESTLKEV
jgi:hypothetical protein